MSPPRQVNPSTFFVNGRRFHSVEGRKLSYAEVVRNAGFPVLSVLTVTYKDGDRGGSMTMESSVLVKDGMIFNVADTSNA